MENKRNSNFELMRIVSMAFIVLWHIIMHGNVISNYYVFNDSKEPIGFALNDNEFATISIAALDLSVTSVIHENEEYEMYADDYNNWQI